MAQFLPKPTESPGAILQRINMRSLLLCLVLLFALSFSSLAQSVVTGAVTADDGSALPGVTVLLKGSTTGTTTDADGVFKISLPSLDGTLVFSFIGYTTQEVPVSGRSTVDVKMTADITELGEVVIVGYGQVKKNDLTGSVVTVDPEQLTKRGSVNAMEAMQGQMPGVDISTSTGRAGTGFRINIRGQQTLESGQPLYVVDGVITPSIDFLNPQDIERIDILKDASSTAIYGSRGIYGVVLVKTKGGSSVKQKAVISYDGYYGIRKPARLPKFMDGDKWWNYRQDSFITPALRQNQAYDANAGNNTVAAGELARRVAEKDYTDWTDLILQDGAQANHWLNISGAGDKLGYTLGVGYQEEEGNFVHEEYKRYNFKGSINHTLNDRWAAGASFNFSVAERELGSPNAVLNAFRMNPLIKPYSTTTGELLLQPGKDIVNPNTPQQVTYIDMTSSSNPLYEMENSSNDTRTYFGLGNVFLQFTPISWLNVKTTFAPSFRYEKNGIFLGTNTEGRVGLLPEGRMANFESFSYVWDNQISFDKTINEHTINAMGLYSLNLFRDENSNLLASNLPYNSSYYNLGSAPLADQRVGSSYRKSTIMSYAVRVNYSFKDKYLLTLSARMDGSSMLAEGHKWATFPAAAVAWKISEENFMNGISFMNNLKLRASYGMTGNNQNVRPYDTQVRANTAAFYDFNGTGASGLAPSGAVQRKLSWEKATEFNGGLDFQLFNARVSGSVDFYNKLTTDVLLKRELPLETGYSSFTDNIGSIRNRGIEVALTTVIVSTDQLTWQTTFNFSKNNNEIVELIDKQDNPGNGWFIGQPVRVNYTYVFDGIWQESEREQAKQLGQEPGQVKVRDFGNPGIDPNEDRRVIGSPLPDWTAGFTTTVTYRGFDFSASLFTRQGVQVYSPFHNEFLNFQDRGRAKLDVDWYMAANNVTPTRYSNEYPQPQNSALRWTGTTGVAAYQDASFTKIKNITLGYTLPSTVVEKLRISSLRVYTNILNPFVFTDYTGFDPEWAESQLAPNTALTNTTDIGGVSSITYQFGVNARF
jgi:TonB-dependent starch-binding outer membrane protein SusC